MNRAHRGPPRQFLGLPAPAKINRFLHVLGRRADGYHEIQSVFVPIDLCDLVDLGARDDERIVRGGDLTGPADDDLAVRAAYALQAAARALPAAAGRPLGADLRVEKHIPVGAGLGGGSSDAATTLLGLNRLWDLNLPRAALLALARGLGADVPFFLGRGAAFVEGVGERCTPLALPYAALVVVFPQVHVSTAEIFADPKLTRDTKRTTIAGFSAALPPAPGADSPASGVVGNALFGANDLEVVVRARYPAVDAAVRLLARYGPARMTGSGSGVFLELPDLARAQRCLGELRPALPAGWSAWAASTLEVLPLADWLAD